MRELFVLDKKNYDPNGSVGRRPSVRGIIVRDGKIAMMHSKKYNYYKLPGGGIEPGETLEETLIREVREESGLVVIPETMKEFGYVRRIEKGRYEDIFVQDNYYFICEAEAEITKRRIFRGQKTYVSGGGRFRSRGKPRQTRGRQSLRRGIQRYLQGRTL